VRIRYALAFLFILISCSQGDSKEEPVSITEQPAAISQAPTQIPTDPISETPTLSSTQPPVSAPTFAATEPPTEEVESPSLNSFALNNVATQERGGVVVEVPWVLVGDKQVFANVESENVVIDSEIFADKPVVAWIVFNITNNSGKGIHLHPRRGTVLVNDEKIALAEYDSYTSVDEKFDGGYYPGEKVIGGGVWFGIEHSELNEINQMIIIMHGPHFPDEDVYAKEYYIVLDLSEHIYEEIPDYLK
jgi:hypothetical protein